MSFHAEYVAALLMGFFGSLHCLGMCGPIAMVVPSVKGDNGRPLSALLYNSGRVITYAILGAILGSIGRSVAIFHWQQTISLTIGICIALFVLWPSYFTALAIRLRPEVLSTAARNGMTYFLKQRSVLSVFLLGIVNGLLPCGLVYLGLAGSLDTNSTIKGALYMASFGIGTIPMMAGAHLMGGNFTAIRRKNLSKSIPFFLMLMAILFIIRGMGLGIPYLSPSIDPHSGDIYCTSPSHRH